MRRVLLLSDLHMDYADNREWLADLCSESPSSSSEDDDDDDGGAQTMIVVAGDVSHDLEILRWTFRTLKAKYAEVAYTPGNHELWIDVGNEKGEKRGDGDGAVGDVDCDYGEDEEDVGPHETSIDKLERVMQMCLDEDVRIGPIKVGGGGGGRAGNSVQSIDDIVGEGGTAASAATITPASAAATGIHGTSSSREGDDGPGVSLLVVPLLSWHHRSFDDEPPIECWGGIPSARRASADYRRTRWPHPLSLSDDSAANFVDSLNDVVLDLDDLDDHCVSNVDDCRGGNAHNVMMTFSHFLPRIELIPEKRYLSLPTLHSCVGSTFLERRLRRMGEKYRTKYENGDVGDTGDGDVHGDDDDDGTTSFTDDRRGHLHAFGHSHLAWDATIDGVRYVHVPLAYPREWKERSKSLEIGSMTGKGRGEGSGDGKDIANARSPVCIWEHPTAATGTSSSVPSSSITTPDEGTNTHGVDGFPLTWLGGWWSKYYAVMERQPHRNTELAPWAAKRFRQLPGGQIEDFDHVKVEERYLGLKDRNPNPFSN